MSEIKTPARYDELPKLLVKVSSARKKGYLRVAVLHPNNMKTLWSKELRGNDMMKAMELGKKQLEVLSKKVKTRKIEYDQKGRRKI